MLLKPKFGTPLQMIDKIWYEWQNAHAENFWAFGGGSVTAHSQPGLYQQYPAGGPPFLTVSE
jgi:tyrosinase